LKANCSPSFQQNASLTLVISRSVFNALNPFDQLAAQALEQLGQVQIVEDEDQQGG
jgi:hypothetical protein